METKFGSAIICSIYGEEEGLMEVFLPKSISMTEKEITEYNGRPNRDMYIIYHGKRDRSFHISFEEEV